MRGSIASGRSRKTVLTHDEVVTYITIPPDGGWGWVIVFASFCVIFISDGATTTYALFKGSIKDTLECSEAAIMIPSSVILALYYLAGKLILSLLLF